MSVSIEDLIKITQNKDELTKMADELVAKIKFSDTKPDSLGNLNIQIQQERNGKPGPFSINMPLLRTSNEGVMTTTNESSGSDSHSVKLFFPRKIPIFVESIDPETMERSGSYEEPETYKVYKNKVLLDPEDPKSPLVDDLDGPFEEVTNDEYLASWLVCLIIEKIYNRVIDHCFENRTKIPTLSSQKNKAVYSALIKNPIYRRSIEGTDDEDMSYAPSVYFKFIESGAKGKIPNTVYTKFTGVDQKPIHWKSLENTMMYCYSNVIIERIFLGSTKNIQCKLSKALVVQTLAREEMSQDNEKVKGILERNPTLAKAFMKSLTSLEAHHGEIKRENAYVKPKKTEPIQIENKISALTEVDQNFFAEVDKQEVSTPVPSLDKFMAAPGTMTAPKRITLARKS